MNFTTQSVQIVEEFFDAMADNLDEGLYLEDPPREVSSGLGSIKVQLTTFKSAIATSSKEGAPVVVPSSSLTNRFKKNGVVTVLSQYEKNLITEDENQRDADVEVDRTQVWYPRFLLSTEERKKDVSVEVIRIRSLGSWCIKEADEFLTSVDSSVHLMYHDPIDLGSMILIQMHP